jgi:uncharacterized protein
VSAYAPVPGEFLLDSNVFIALCSPEHMFFAAAQDWYEKEVVRFALCPIVEGAWLRTLLRLHPKRGLEEGLATLNAYKQLTNCMFWPDTLSYTQIDWRGVMGHKQVTDAYLVALAKSKNARLASFDRGLAALNHESVCLVAG